MSERKTSFVLPTDCLDDLADFSDKEAGELFRAILEYANSQIETEFSDRAMKMYFNRIKKYIDCANENYEKMIQARSEAGSKGGRPKKSDVEKQKKQKLFEESKKSKSFFEKAKKADTESESESDTDTDTDAESDIRESTREKTPPRNEKHGENGKVELTDDEFNRLAEQMGVSKRDEYIERLDDYIASKGVNYKSHYATIRNWYRRDGGQQSTASFDTDEFVKRGERLPSYQGGTS